jgi:hypothetical protein
LKKCTFTLAQLAVFLKYRVVFVAATLDGALEEVCATLDDAIDRLDELGATLEEAGATLLDAGAEEDATAVVKPHCARVFHTVFS